MQEVAVEKDCIPRRELTKVRRAKFLDSPLDSFGISPSLQSITGIAHLVADQNVIYSAHFMAARYDLKAAVGLVARVESYKSRSHVRCQAAVQVPVAVVLVPYMTPACL